MAERTAEQVRTRLKNQLIVYDPTFEDPNEQFRQIVGGALGSRRMTREEAAQAAGIPVEQLTKLEPELDLGSNERTALYQQYITPGRGTGFFSSLLGGVGGVIGGLTDTVVDPVANALNVHPDAIKAAAALAGMYYAGGGTFFDTATNAVVPEAVATDMIAATLGAEGLAVPATASAAAPAAATAAPVVASPLATMGAATPYTAAELAAFDAAAGLTAPANALAPTAAATAAGAAVPGLNFEQIAAESLGANLPGVAEGVSGSSVFTPATAATTAVTNALTPTLNHEQIAAESLGANVPGAATGVAGAATFLPGTTGLTFDTLAKFAKDYGVPLSSLISGITGAQAAKSAADVQAESAREARQLARDIFNEQKALQEPFRTAGISAQNQLLTLLGLPGGTQGAEFGRYARPFGMQDFQADPGYAFRLSEGLKALEASRAAQRGGSTGLLSGATGKALQRYGQDLASQEYGNAFNRYQTERVNRLQPLGALMGTGQAAASNQGAAAGQYGQTAGGLTTDIGAVTAGGQLGAARAISNALSAYGNYMGNQNLAQAIRESQYNR